MPNINPKHQNAPLETSQLDFLNPNKGLLYEHRRAPEAIIRFSGEFSYGESLDMRVADTLDGLRAAKELFDELEKDHGISTAGFSPMLSGKGRGDVQAMIVSRRIEGQHYEPQGELPAEVRPAAKELFTKLTAYLSDKIENNKPYLRDIFNIGQYLYNKSGNEFILVDVDPYFCEDAEDDSELAWSINELNTWSNLVLNKEEQEAWYEKITSDGDRRALQVFLDRLGK